MITFYPEHYTRDYRTQNFFYVASEKLVVRLYVHCWLLFVKKNSRDFEKLDKIFRFQMENAFHMIK